MDVWERDFRYFVGYFVCVFGELEIKVVEIEVLLLEWDVQYWLFFKMVFDCLFIEGYNWKVLESKEDFGWWDCVDF